MTFNRYFKWSTPEFDGIVAGKFCCPCCGYPTLDAWSGYGICGLCWWEDDGTGDLCARRVRSGPNSSYSLAEARANFEDHGDMYRYGGTRISVVSVPSTSRLALLSFVQSLDPDQQLDMETFLHLLGTAS
jgi:hypothetical protein